MEFNDILNRHLSTYIRSGASVPARVGFLVCLFKELKESGIDPSDHKKNILNSLLISFFHRSLTSLYETCVLRDIEKALSLVGNIPIKKQIEKDSPKVTKKSDDDLSEAERQEIKNRKEHVDFEFLKSLGTDMEYLKSLGYKE